MSFKLLAQNQYQVEYSKNIVAKKEQGVEKKTAKYQGLIWMVPAKKYYKGTLPIKQIEKVLLKNQYIDCLYIHIGWDLLESVKGEMNFKKLDKIIELAHKYNKPYKLTLVPGTHSPKWVYDKKIQIFESKDSNPHHKNYGHIIRFPLPWDKIYLETWFTSITTFLSRYREDPYFVAVTLTGPNMISPEWHLAKRAEDMIKWIKYDDFRGKIRDAWIETIKKYASVLRHQRFILEASSTPVVGMKKEAIEVIEFGVKNYPNRFTLQTDQLNGRGNQITAPPYKRIMDYRNKIYVGFQNVAFLGNGEQKRQGTFEMTVFNYVQAEAHYLELWFGDGQNQSTSKKLRDMINKAKQMGLAKYKKLLIEEGKYKDQPDNYWKKSVKFKKAKRTIIRR